MMMHHFSKPGVHALWTRRMTAPCQGSAGNLSWVVFGLTRRAAQMGGGGA